MNILELLKKLGGLGQMPPMPGQQGQTIPGIGGNVQLPGGGGFGMPQGGMGLPQAQPQQPSQPSPDPTQPQGLMQKIMGGLGRARDSVTPIDPGVASTMDPEQIKALRKQAMFRSGLGMLGAAGSHDFGGTVAAGLGQGLGGFDKSVNEAYGRNQDQQQIKREEARQVQLDERYKAETGRQRERESVADKQWQQTFDANQQYRKDSLASLEKRAATKAAPGVTMTDKAIDFAAGRLLNGEPANKVLANFGRGAQGAQNITAVQNRLAEMAADGGVNPQLMATITQELSADARTRLELGAREGKVAPRVQEAQNFARIAIDASRKVPRGSFLPWTKLSQMTDKQLNDPNLAAAKAATVSLINAYAGAVGGGQMHVHDQQVAENMLNTAQSEEAYEAVVNQLITETEAALDAPGDVMERMRNKGTGGPPSPQAPVGDVVNWADLK